jgi:hypothetical protein
MSKPHTLTKTDIVARALRSAMLGCMNEAKAEGREVSSGEIAMHNRVRVRLADTLAFDNPEFDKARFLRLSQA